MKNKCEKDDKLPVAYVNCTQISVFIVCVSLIHCADDSSHQLRCENDEKSICQMEFANEKVTRNKTEEKSHSNSSIFISFNFESAKKMWSESFLRWSKVFNKKVQEEEKYLWIQEMFVSFPFFVQISYVIQLSSRF